MSVPEDTLDCDKPFADRFLMSGGDVQRLRDWLAANANRAKVIARAYDVGDLIDDLDEILSGMWNDGIDAMGEDA